MPVQDNEIPTGDDLPVREKVLRSDFHEGDSVADVKAFSKKLLDGPYATLDSGRKITLRDILKRDWGEDGEALALKWDSAAQYWYKRAHLGVLRDLELQHTHYIEIPRLGASSYTNWQRYVFAKHIAAIIRNSIDADEFLNGLL